MSYSLQPHALQGLSGQCRTGSFVTVQNQRLRIIELLLVVGLVGSIQNSSMPRGTCTEPGIRPSLLSSRYSEIYQKQTGLIQTIKDFGGSQADHRLFGFCHQFINTAR